MCRFLGNAVIGCWILLANALAEPVDVTAVQYSGNGQFIAAGYKDGRIALFDRKSNKKLWDHSGERRQISSLNFRKQDTQLIAFERFGLIRCLDVASGREVKKVEPVFGDFYGKAQSRLALAEFDKESDLFALAGEFTPVIYLIEAEQTITGAETLVVTDGIRQEDPETSLTIWTRKDNLAQNPAVQCELIAPGSGGFTDMRFSSRYGTAIAVNKEAQLLFVWKVVPQRLAAEKENLSPVMRKFGRSDGMNTGLAIGADGDFVTVGYTKKYGGVQLWDFARTEMIHWVDYPHPGGTANRAVFSHSGDICITSDELKNCVWQKKGGKLERLGQFWHGGMTGINERSSAIAFSPDDKELAIGIGPAIGVTAMNDLKDVKYIGPERPKLRGNPLIGE
jgi:WD40 repeat protein